MTTKHSVVYCVSVVERPSASEIPLPAPCCILLFFLVFNIFVLHCCVHMELHSVRMLYSTRCAHAVFSLNCTFHVRMHRSRMRRLRIPPLFLHNDSVSLIFHLFRSHVYFELILCILYGTR